MTRPLASSVLMQCLPGELTPSSPFSCLLESRICSLLSPLFMLFLLWLMPTKVSVCEEVPLTLVEEMLRPTVLYGVLPRIVHFYFYCSLIHLCCGC